MVYKIEFYEDESGRKPALSWIRDDLDVRKRRTLGTAMREILQQQGVGVCGSPFGRQLGGGLFEFRLRDSELLLRVFCHAMGTASCCCCTVMTRESIPRASGRRGKSLRPAIG
jgi:phage-related protein